MSETQAPVYVVDDDLSMRESVASLFRSAGLEVETFASANEFLARSRSKLPGCLVLDVKLPGLSGLDLQQELAKADVQIPIIFLTGYGDIPSSVRAIKSGALEFFTKPFDDESLLAAVRQAIARSRGAPQKKGARIPEDQMVGESSGFKALMDRIALVARTDASVLILGETGTGKELVARSIHARSARSSRPLVSMNCGAIQPSLIASELFGHEKGSFTGAVQQRAGRFELADGGTIFLDEIGEMPITLQPKLLRALEEREVLPVGATTPVKIDIRIIAATNRDLKQEVEEKHFREDLYYRLNVIELHIPPLRERREDIPLLVDYLIQRHNRDMKKAYKGVDNATMKRLMSLPWKGNVRELDNVLERAMILGNGEWINPTDLPRWEAAASTPEAASSSDNLKEAVQSYERSHIETVLKKTDGDKKRTAELLGLSLSSLYRKMDELSVALDTQE